MLPSKFLGLPKKERAFLVAAIQIKMEAEKKKEKEMKRKTSASRRKK